MKVIAFILILIAVGTGFYFFSGIAKTKKNTTPVVNTTPPTTSSSTNISNPASMHCNKQGGQSEIRTASDGSQSGVCILKNGNECDEWKFFKGECK